MSELVQDLRRGRITSSVAAACLGVDPWCTPMQAWEKITGRARPDDEAPGDQYERGELDPKLRGHALEEALIRFAGMSASKKFRRPMTCEHPSTIERSDLPWAADSVDAVLIPYHDPPMLCVEAKSVAYSAPDGAQWGSAAWTDDVPIYVKVQSAWHLKHWPTTIATCVPTIIGSGLMMRVYLVPRDNVAIDSLVNILGEWHRRHVQGDTPPPARAGDEETIARLFPRPTKPKHDDDPAIAELAMLDVTLREQIGELEGRRKEARAELASRLREYELCEGPWGRVTFGMQKRSPKVDYKAVCDELLRHAGDTGRAVIEKIIEAHTKPGGEIRAMRTYGRNGE